MAGRKRISDGLPGLVEHEPAGRQFKIKRRTPITEWPAGEGDGVAQLDVAVLFAEPKMARGPGRVYAIVSAGASRSASKKHNLLTQHELSERVVSIWTMTSRDGSAFCLYSRKGGGPRRSPDARGQK